VYRETVGRSRVIVTVMSIVLAAGCYSPSATLGVPCTDALECPGDQVCDTTLTPPTCVKMLSLGVDAPSIEDAASEDDSQPADASIDAMIDAATPIGPANDLPANATDIAAGGTFMFDITNANDNYASTCGNGKDVYFKLNLTAPEVIYLDTFGSAANASIVIRPGTCTAFTGAATACVADSCGGTQVQGAWNLPAGNHCVIVDHPGTATGMQMLKVTRGGRAGDALMGATGTVMGDTCADDNSNNAQCGCEGAEDHHYFFTVCPAATVMANLKTCGGATWDTVLQIRNSNNTSLACEDDDEGACGIQTDITETISTPGLYWAIVDGCEDCGPYTLTYSIQ
jgi:hypothetical protein